MESSIVNAFLVLAVGWFFMSCVVAAAFVLYLNRIATVKEKELQHLLEMPVITPLPLGKDEEPSFIFTVPPIDEDRVDSGQSFVSVGCTVMREVTRWKHLRN